MVLAYTNTFGFNGTNIKNTILKVKHMKKFWILLIISLLLIGQTVYGEDEDLVIIDEQLDFEPRRLRKYLT